ncbi:cation:proton antiporter [Ramlibacter sp. AW1]|uniref:Cation:proton antiporter n=1 Tax=Ramlibacter aurantiacus TaxID=2801330 RepID=A0A936ZNM4_9BURK|nr:monovalent cation:proton antiporter family protein [Ramlibacter aurantiacus]MBL0420655.1 cation:proton antiporter [Ramlibacter aurantiacus]
MPSLSVLHQVLWLLGLTVAVILVFQRFQLPTSLGYLLVGVLLAPTTFGPTIHADQVRPIAEFGIVFLLFTIGLNFSLPQILALRHLVLGLGTAQVALTTAGVGLLAWLAGTPPAAAFVVGAVFAQSSTTIISKQLADQGEEDERHSRLGVAMSVFQDVTAVPFVVVIPVLASAAGLSALGTELGWALAKAALALGLVFGLGRWVLRPLFAAVGKRRSAELFTLAVLFVSILAGWVTNYLGLSMAFGAFLAGMVLGETEFRHQVEATIRPFRDVLLGLFFVGIGLLVDLRELAQVWQWGLLGAAVLMAAKTLIVAGIVRAAGIDTETSWRTGLLLSVGGEFGFALLALALQNQLASPWLGQVMLASVLFSMIAAPLLIRHNGRIARLLSPSQPRRDDAELRAPGDVAQQLKGHVLVCGYGRIGQGLGHFLHEEKIPFVALDLDPERVRDARAAGEPVYFGDAGSLDVLDGLGLGSARLVVISHDDTGAALRTLQQLRQQHPQVPVLVRTRDLSTVEELQAAGATAVIPETLEAGLMIASHALMHTGVPVTRIEDLVRLQRQQHYLQQRALFGGREPGGLAEDDGQGLLRLKPMRVPGSSPVIGQRVSEVVTGATFNALVRRGERLRTLEPEMALQADDVVVVSGTRAELLAVEARLQGWRAPPSPRTSPG